MRARGSVGAVLRVWAIIILITGAFSRSAQAQVEIWTSSSGGYWDDFRNWSLGAPPTNSDSVFITNAISETVTIDWYTSGTYPESLTISDLTVLASGSATNTLFLSDAGTTTPLQMHDTLMILSGGALLMTNSSLLVGDVAGVNFALEAPASFSGTNFLSGGIAVGYSTNSVGSISMGDGQTAFTNGYTVIGFYGSGQVSLANGILQAGDDISVPNGIFFGLSSGSEGVLSIGGGSYLAPENLTLGLYAGSTGLVWVTGGQLIQTNNLLTTIGGDGVGQLVLSNGQLLASQVMVGDGAGSQGTLAIAGGTGNFSGSLVVGVGQTATGTVSITGGQLAVTNGSVIVGNFGVGQMVVSNALLLAQSMIVGNCNGGILSNKIGSAYLTTNGIFRIAGGVTSISSNLTAGVFSNAIGVIQISGGNLTVTNQSGTGQLVVGQLGNGSLVQAGGVLMVDQLTFASAAISNVVVKGGTNFVSFVGGIGQGVLSNGQLLAQTVALGLGTNTQAALTIAGGAMSVASNMLAGVFPNATGVIQVTGGSLAVTNQFGTAQLVVGLAGLGTFAQSGGVVTVDQLLVTNGTYSVSGGQVVEPQWALVTNGTYSTFRLGSGVFNTMFTMVNNALTFVVGDGIDAAMYHLLGGFHSFAIGLEVRSNAVLSGCGVIDGNVVVDAGGAILADCGGTLTFTGIVTNNGSWTAINGSVLEAYGPVVNNGVINVLDGTTNFHAGFINNGVVLDSNSIPQILSVSVVGSGVEVRFTTSSSPTYVLEYTSDLVTGSWTPLVAFTGPGGDVIVTDFEALQQTQRFYRVRLVVPP